MGSVHRIVDRIALKNVDGEDNTEANNWQNRDLIPLPPIRRTWTHIDFVGLWSSVFLNTFGWQVTSGLLAVGLNVWQAVIVNLIGRAIQLLAVVGFGWSGGVWHIGYTVTCRAVFGVRGAFIPVALRSGLLTVWYAIQAFTGGQLISVLLSTLSSGYQNMPNHFPKSASMTTKQFVGFVIYCVGSVAAPVLIIKSEKLKNPFKFALVINTITIFGLSIGLIAGAGGVGSLVSTPATSKNLGWAFMSGITATVGGVASGTVGQSDFSRFASRPGNQLWPQIFAVTVFGNIVPVFGLLGTAAAGKMYGDVNELGLWNPPAILQTWLDRSYHNATLRAAAFFVSLGLIVSVIALNTVDNGISAAMDLAGLAPRFINIRRGCVIVIILSVAMNPWQIIAKASTFESVISSFGVILYPLIGVLSADYWVVRRQKLKLTDLYTPSRNGVYHFAAGWNWRAFVAWIFGLWPAVPGLVSLNPNLTSQINEGWIHYFNLAVVIGFIISATTHIALNKLFPPVGLAVVDEYDHFGTFTPAEATKLGLISNSPSEGSYASTAGHESPNKPELSEKVSAF